MMEHRGGRRNGGGQNGNRQFFSYRDDPIIEKYRFFVIEEGIKCDDYFDE